jgi:hypothetical protein
MFEFSLSPPSDLSKNGAACSRRTVARLKKLAVIAAKLEKAGWRVWLTMTGLAFVLPETVRKVCGDIEYEESMQLVASQLTRLGIDEEFSSLVGKTVDQMPDSVAWWMWHR